MKNETYLEIASEWVSKLDRDEQESLWVTNMRWDIMSQVINTINV